MYTRWSPPPAVLAKNGRYRRCAPHGYKPESCLRLHSDLLQHTQGKKMTSYLSNRFKVTHSEQFDPEKEQGVYASIWHELAGMMQTGEELLKAYQSAAAGQNSLRSAVSAEAAVFISNNLEQLLRDLVERNAITVHQTQEEFTANKYKWASEAIVPVTPVEIAFKKVFAGGGIVSGKKLEDRFYIERALAMSCGTKKEVDARVNLLLRVADYTCDLIGTGRLAVAERAHVSE